MTPQGWPGHSMPRYWITIFWPPLKNEPHTYSVYFQQRHLDVAQQLQPGDRVLFYELLTGPARVDETPDGVKTIRKRVQGRGGVIAIGTVSAVVRPFSWPDHAVQTYEDRSRMHWAWEVPVSKHDFTGF